MRLTKENYEDIVSKLEEAHEWAHQNKHIEEMDAVIDLTYEALLFLSEAK